MGGRRMVERLAEQYPDITLGTTPGRAPGAWSEFARRLRLGIDYLRYLDPRYADTPHLTRRARDRAPRSVVALAERPGTGGRVRSSPVCFARSSAAFRSAPTSRRYIRDRSPDVVIITPLVELGSPQMDHLAAAKALGCQDGARRRELGSPVQQGADPQPAGRDPRVERDPEAGSDRDARHRRQIASSSPARTATTSGSAAHRREAERASARASDCGSDRPFIVYLCSSLFRGTASEPAFVERWVETIRTSTDPRLKDIGILIRPHPARPDEWKQLDLSGFKNIAFWGEHPVDEEAKNDYFDSMYYSAAVVGSEYERVPRGGGRRKARAHGPRSGDLEGQPGRDDPLPLPARRERRPAARRAHARRARAAACRIACAGRRRRRRRRTVFVEGFIRPFGASEAATPRFADAIETARRPLRRRVRRVTGLSSALLRLALYPAVGALQLLLVTQPYRKHVAPAAAEVVPGRPPPRVRLS